MRRDERDMQSGAAALEALGMMLLLTSMVFIIMFIGVGFYNLTILNTTAQTSSLSAQTQLDRYCSQQFIGLTGCQTAKAKARSVTQEILDEAAPQMMFLKPGTLRAVPASDGGIVDLRPAGSNTSIQTPTGSWMQPGWGYSYVQLEATFSIWNQNSSAAVPGLTGDTTLRARSITPSYKDPNG